MHTGQHYDFNMSDAFFRDLALPNPTFHLGVGSGTHAVQTAGVMVAYEEVCLRDRPDWIIVVGDVNSTAACAIVGAKLHIPVAHLEAGLRSGDRRMPEEINRLITDSIADLLWTPSPDADENLRREGVDSDKIELIGNVMIDSFEMMRPSIEASDARERLGLNKRDYAVVTLHRPSNVDNPGSLTRIVDQLAQASLALPLVFVAHPRTVKNLRDFGLFDKIESVPAITVVDPLPYIDFMSVLTGAKIAVTDSGGLQEETTHLGIPCLTLRENTERPITITDGTNQLVSAAELVNGVERSLTGPKAVRPIPLWDGKAAHRAAASLERRRS